MAGKQAAKFALGRNVLTEGVASESPSGGKRGGTCGSVLKGAGVRWVPDTSIGAVAGGKVENCEAGGGEKARVEECWGIVGYDETG